MAFCHPTNSVNPYNADHEKSLAQKIISFEPPNPASEATALRRSTNVLLLLLLCSQEGCLVHPRSRVYAFTETDKLVLLIYYVQLSLQQSINQSINQSTYIGQRHTVSNAL